MDSNEIESLLEKYWQCETSLEEEIQLRKLFATGSIPSSMPEASDLFTYFEQQRNKPLADKDFDSAIIKKINAASPEAKTVNMFFNIAKIAAGLLVVVAASYLVMKEVRRSYPAELADTYSDPKLALEETKKALMLISKGFGKAQKEASKMEIFNEAEKAIQGRSKTDSKLKM